MIYKNERKRNEVESMINAPLNMKHNYCRLERDKAHNVETKIERRKDKWKMEV